VCSERSVPDDFLYKDPTSDILSFEYMIHDAYMLHNRKQYYIQSYIYCIIVFEVLGKGTEEQRSMIDRVATHALLESKI